MLFKFQQAYKHPDFKFMKKSIFNPFLDFPLIV
jgi:hypothetical protein